MIVQGIATSLHIGWCYIFIDVLDMEARGAGVATTISNFTLMIGLHLYTENYIKKE
jgi:Na+-driven multidrug efflux pump